MCGIVGYIGPRNAVDVIMHGLSRLEYRGYDSAGISVLDRGAIQTIKRVGKLDNLEGALVQAPLTGRVGIGHTRWATHGSPSEANAHPHVDGSGTIVVVHNGIIENYQSLRALLTAEGIAFRSQTDTEVLPHLIRKHYTGDLFESVKRALREVRGAYAIAVICASEPERLVAARQGSPLVLGVGDGEAFVASDVPAILHYTRRVGYLADGQVADVRPGSFVVQNVAGEPQTVEVQAVSLDESMIEKGGFPHFMLKEIYQQPEVVGGILGTYTDGLSISFPELRVDSGYLRDCSKITIAACGTAYHAGLVGKYLIENIARVPVEVDVASEFRYRNPIVERNAVLMTVSQSGETADTLEAIRIARHHGAHTVAVVNVLGSSIDRESSGAIHTHAGPEIGVASTKAYTAQITAFALLAIYLGRMRKVLAEADVEWLLGELRRIPEAVQRCLDRGAAVAEMALKPEYNTAATALYLGRAYNYPTALEGALKMKEISYIHAEGYAAGEMKHGPIALITEAAPTVAVAVQSETYEKMISNIQEIRARKGPVIAVATEGDEDIYRHSDDVLHVPACYEPFSPIAAAVPLQLLAYHVAVVRGCDVDKPRNLAKSVTVE